MAIYKADVQQQFEVFRNLYLGPKTDIDEANQAFIKWDTANDGNIKLLEKGLTEKVITNISSTGSTGILRTQMMKEGVIVLPVHDFQTGITVNVTPDEAFKDINNVTKWWTENLEGNSQQLNDEFTVRFGDMHYSKQKLVEIIQGEKIVWLVTGSNLSWLNNKHEWNNTIISFEITRKDNKTRIHFTHFGLVPEIGNLLAYSFPLWQGSLYVFAKPNVSNVVTNASMLLLYDQLTLK